MKSIYADAIEEMKESLPARGVWIEIPVKEMRILVACVTPREGSVD